jgi:thioesterase domain-containing protein
MLWERIEPLASLGIEWLDSSDEATRCRIPLAGNRNDKGTFFAGSQYSALVLAGWYHAALWARAQGLGDKVAIKEGSVRYPKAAMTDLTVTARFQQPPDLRPSGHWRARVESVAVDATGDLAAVLISDYRILSG